jgi:hypothetical protein
MPSGLRVERGNLLVVLAREGWWRLPMSQPRRREVDAREPRR